MGKEKATDAQLGPLDGQIVSLDIVITIVFNYLQ